MSSSRLQQFVKPLENKVQKKVSSEMDDFWEDCIDTPKLKESENNRANNNNKNNETANNNNPDENPEEYITFNIKNGKSNPNQNPQANQNMQVKGSYYNQNNLNNNNSNNSMPSMGLPPKDPKLSSNAKTQSTGRVNNFEETDANNNSMRESNRNRNANRSANHTILEEMYKKYEMESFISPEEEEYLRHQKKKKEEALERCMMLYERAKIKNEVNKINFFKNMEIKENMELEECSFHPQINERKNKQEENLKLVYKNTKIYNRSVQWKENKQHKIDKNRREMSRDTEETFQPRINYANNLNSVFNNKNSVQNNDSSMNYIVRVMKNRQQNDERQKELDTTLAKKAGKNWGNTKKANLNTSIKNLRDELHSFAADSD